MNIYKLKSDNNYSSLTYKDDGISTGIFYHVNREDYEYPVPDMASCQGRASYAYYEKKRKGFANFIAGANNIVVEQVIKDVLDEHLLAYGEWLEVNFEGRLIYCFRVNNVFHALSKKSGFKAITPTYREIRSPVFPDELGDKSFIFKAIGLPTDIFVNEEFKCWIESLGFTGLLFSKMPLDSEVGENLQLS